MTDKSNDECRSYRRMDRICADGFIQTPACSGHDACFTCGKPSRFRPYCEWDELPAHMATDDGRPLFYRADERKP